jgi:3'-phosphoadenosine 5'-phosphosulfate sulfotransferase (PAPS reductase)/FAD synthetase
MAKTRHLLGISGGKDSAALAVYMRDRVPEMEYFFTDTGKELAETYEFLERLEAFLGKTITRLNPDRDFDHWLEIYGGYLPSPNMRWCTRMLKIKPFEDFVGDDQVISYIAIRADENRDGYISTKPNIKPLFPFKEAGIKKADVFRLLEESGVGLPDYYQWRSRSGCYFCFYQRKSEWIGLKERHPDLYELSKKYEKMDEVTGIRYTWNEGEGLDDLENPERVAAIKEQSALRLVSSKNDSNKLVDILSYGDDDDVGCLSCHL